MVKMESFYLPQNKLQELCNEIDRCHLSYLDMEESREKLNHRIKLEEYIYEYLCLASHYQKFKFPETEEVLHKSATCKKDFSAYKAGTGFNAIQMYAGNLLSQPWRKEYRQIKTYCGFYKHQIEANLSEPEIMFEALGYDHVGNGLLSMNPETHCSDRVVDLSRDCLVAYVECQILKAIWEELQVSWLEVLEFRRAHPCTPEQAIREMKLRQQQRHEHARSYSQGSDPYANGRCQNLVPAMGMMSSTNHSFPPPSHHHVGLPNSTEYVYGGSCCQNNYAPSVPPCAYYPTPYYGGQPLMKPQFNLNGYYYNGYSAPVQPYRPSVPTAKLIEVEPSRSKNNNDSTDGDKDSHLEDWDYVYKNLESQGYSKDLGERGDLLSPRGQKKAKATNLDNVLNNLVVSDRPVKVVEQPKPTVKRVNNPEPSPTSSYENLVPEEDKKKIADKEDRNRNPSSSAGSNRWFCKACTYLNEGKREICDMCSKSRHTVTEPPMEIGGAECSQCTLVNPKNLKACQACGRSLKDSPTYI